MTLKVPFRFSCNSGSISIAEDFVNFNISRYINDPFGYVRKIVSTQISDFYFINDEKS